MHRWRDIWSSIEHISIFNSDSFWSHFDHLVLQQERKEYEDLAIRLCGWRPSEALSKGGMSQSPFSQYNTAIFHRDIQRHYIVSHVTCAHVYITTYMCIISRFYHTGPDQLIFTGLAIHPYRFINFRPSKETPDRWPESCQCETARLPKNPAACGAKTCWKSSDTDFLWWIVESSWLWTWNDGRFGFGWTPLMFIAKLITSSWPFAA